MSMSQYVKNPKKVKKKPPKINPLLRKKVKAQYTYLKLEVDYHDEEFKKAKIGFNNHFKNVINKDKETAFFSGKNTEASEDKKPPIDIDIAYKKIAQKVHPDKKGGSDKTFQELREAINNSDLEKILSIASEHNIDLEKDSDINLHQFYAKGIEKLQSKLDYFTKTMAWQWWYGDDDMKKAIEMNITHLYGKNEGDITK